MAKALKLWARAEIHCSYEEFYLLEQGLKDCSSDLRKKIPPVVSLNAGVLRVSHGMKFKVAKKCLYSKEEE